MGKINSTHKKIFFGFIFIVVLSLIVLAFQHKRVIEMSKEEVASEFLKTYYTVDSSDIAELLTNSMLNADDMSKAMEEFEAMIIEKYGKYLTEKGFTNALANRYLPGYEMDIQKTILRGIEVVDISFPKTDTYDSGAEYFKYNVTARTISEDNLQNELELEGEIIMIKDENGWKIDMFRPGFFDLGITNSLEGSEAEIISDKGEFTLIHVSEDGDILLETSNISSDEKEKINAAIMDYMLRSAAWEALPVEEMGDHYIIIQKDSEGREERYHLFRIEDKLALQWEEANRWSFITEQSYNNVEEVFKSHEE